ncbi:MAG: prenyltransferase [Planctomycetota bacterium]|jgi:1,4-dihydroxy-2-naphthoate octaprenyltransferase
MEPARPAPVPLILRLSRAHYSPVILIPILTGTGVAWWGGWPIRPVHLALALVGGFAAHLGANTVNDVFDFESGADRIAETRDSKDFGGSDVLVRGWMSPGAAHAAAWAFFFAAGACGAVLVVLAGWPVAMMGGLGFLLAYFYVAPPVRYGYMGRGLGEIAIFVAFGPLPVLGGFFVQAETLTPTPLVASLPAAFYTTAILFNHHFTHPEGDRAVGKISPVVALGPARALGISRVIVAASYVSLIAACACGALPLPCLAGLLTTPLIVLAYRNVLPDSPSETFMALTAKTAGVNLLTGLLVLIGLVLGRFMGV